MSVSAQLASEVTKRVRERGLVVWLDSDHQFTGLVDALARGEHGFSYPVVGLRGSYLELMMALKNYASGLHPDHLLIHLPGLNKDSVRETPAFELYKAGTLFERNLASLVRDAAVGTATPDEIDVFLRGTGLAVDAADAWLDGLRGKPRDHVTLLFEALGVDDVAIGFVTHDRRVTEHLPKAGKEALEFLERGLGLNLDWRKFRLGPDVDAMTPDAMAAVVGSFLVTVEFVDDLREAPLTPELIELKKLGPFTAVCRRLAARLREQHADLYEQLAVELEGLLAQDKAHDAAVLGSIDTFRFEEQATRDAAFDAIKNGDWSSAEIYAAPRTIEGCFWVKRSAMLQDTWELIRLAAITGVRIAATQRTLTGSLSLEDIVARYTTSLAIVDHAHRTFEQRAHALLGSQLDDYERLLEIRTAIRVAYRGWADTQARAFFELCRSQGPLPTRDLRQRAIYDDVVHPLASDGGGVAYFMIDALRFEMAQALAEELKKEKYSVRLTARLAELPTVTAVGMNALAPVERNGRLRAVQRKGAIEGWLTSAEFSVCSPPDRVRAMVSQSLSGPERIADFKLETLREISPSELRKTLAKRPALVVVRSTELDAAGEHGLHLGTFEQTLVQIRSAIALLTQNGIARFVIASDHGFLLQDATTQSIPIGANMRVAERRHAMLDAPSGMSDVLELRLSALEYDVESEAHLVFRPDTAVWQTRSYVAPYVHGGNSLQERVIPVLEVERTTTRGRAQAKYEVVARAMPAERGRQRLQVTVRLEDRHRSLGLFAPKSIRLALRVPQRPDVVVTLIDAKPPATLSDGKLSVAPNREEAIVEFELEGTLDERVRVEIFHPDAVEEVAPTVVEEFFEVVRDRRLPKEAATAATPPAVSPPPAKASTQDWSALIDDPGFRQVFEIIFSKRTINELELHQILGSGTRVRAFARNYDALVKRLSFEVEIRTVNGLKAYVRKD